MPTPRNSQPAKAKRRIALIQSASTRRASSAPDSERERDRAERVARVEHRGVDHHRREAQQRVEPDAFRRRRAGGGEGVRVEDHQRDEEAAEAEQDRPSRSAATSRMRRRVRNSARLDHSDSSQAHSSSEPFLRGPHGGRPVEQRRRAAGGVGDGVEGEVVAQEGHLEHGEGDGQDPEQRVDRAAARVRELEAPCAHAVDRGADPVRADAQRQQQAGVAEPGHQPARRRSGRGAGSVFARPVTSSASRRPAPSCTSTDTW